jgi:hypothetical protein
VRNRWLDPHRGRWLTSDPNATGQVVIGLAHHGDAIDVGILDPNLAESVGDGTSLYEYVSGDPVNGGDPTGLFSYLELLGASTNLMDLQSDWAQDVGNFGMTLKGAAESVFSDAAIYQMADVEWAMDWDAADDDYSSNGTERPEEQQTRHGGGSVRGPAMAVIYPNEAAVHRGAAASRHGKPRHYTAMADTVIKEIRKQGGSIKDYDIEFNKAINGVRIRTDWILKDKTGKIVAVGEVAASQPIAGAKAKMRMLGDAIKRTSLKRLFKGGKLNSVVKQV